jgi:hypothetical protein
MAVQIPFPPSNNPGLKPQEGTGRLVNCFVEERGDGTPVWRRAPGASVFARAPSVGAAGMEIDANARGGTFFSTFFELIGSSTYQFDASATTKAITYPTGTTANDLVFLALAADDATVDFTTPSGFAEFATTVSFMNSQLMWKVSTGETTFNLPLGTTVASAAVVGLIWTIRGAMSTAPICDTGTVSTGASGDPLPAAFTCTTADGLLITVAFVDDDVVTRSTLTLAPTTLTVSAATTFGCGGELYAGSTGAAGTAAASILVGFRPMASTVAISAFSTWTADAGDDEWATFNLSVRHD